MKPEGGTRNSPRLPQLRSDVRQKLTAVAFAAALCATTVDALVAQNGDDRAQEQSRTHPFTPIEHVIIIVGENHTFDNFFATYQPRAGETVSNLLSKGIVNADGSPGSRFALAAQQQARDETKYMLSPTKTGPYTSLPRPQTTYATGVPPGVPDARFPANLPNGPFQITKYVPYSAFTGDPIHRFFQMWQETDQGHLDLFPWVSVTVGIGPQNSPPAPTPGHTGTAGEPMGFFNMSRGDVPIFKALADRYAISDNYHQPIMGGTGANFLAIVTGDEAFFNTGGVASQPFANQIENPDPQPGTNNFYTQDGYGGGSYINCGDRNQPGVAAIRNYLESLPHKPFRNGNCAEGHYYLVN
ncbi:MAG TPA: alkaline phosphatase family protein, partial [Candidatus Dormibacteraeota bacterium]|nr:alkaline phosphatase family protein [Candidatus Dormibacteraeota bacterium]